MKNQYTISLSQKDKELLHSYTNIALSIATLWENCCEIVLHSLENLDASVIFIINGHLSDRKIGSPISQVTLSFLNTMIDNPTTTHVNYFAKNENNELVKSSIAAIYGEEKKIIGLFCVNIHAEIPISAFIRCMTPHEGIGDENFSETFVENTQVLMLNTLDEVKNSVYNNFAISSSNKNKEIITILYQKGIFNLKDSVITIANHLKISKNTVYMHIRKLHK